MKKIVPATGEVTVFVYDAAGKLVAEYSTTIETANPQISYLTNDHLGSPRILTDQNGAVVSRRDFHPFGEEIVRAGYGQDTIREKFATYDRDGESGLDYAQARYYSANLGRFFSIDPENADADEEVPQTWNAYAYARNNPLKYADPSGEGVEICSGQDCRYYSEREWMTFLEANKKSGDFTFRGNNAYYRGNTEEVAFVIRSSSMLDESQMHFIRETADQSIKKAKVVGIAAASAVVVGACVGTGACAVVGSGLVIAGKILLKKTLKYSLKITKQMPKRGWTRQQVEATIKNPHATARTTFKGTGESATAYINKDGSYVVVKDATREIIQVSDKTRPWNFPGDWKWK